MPGPRDAGGRFSNESFLASRPMSMAGRLRPEKKIQRQVMLERGWWQ